MRDENTYNGWTNNATWRVHLEMFDGFDVREYMDGDLPDVYGLAEWLKEYADDCVSNYGQQSCNLAVDYARAFLADVNWREIAEHILDQIQEEEGA